MRSRRNMILNSISAPAFTQATARASAFTLATAFALTMTFTAFLMTPAHAFAHDGHHHHSSMDSESAATPTPILDESIYNLKSTWTTQDKKTVTLADFSGRTLVAAMVYTSCRDACPMLVEDMKKIERGLSKTALHDTTFVLFSFDTKRDTPDQLKSFASKRKLTPERWTLLHGDEKAVRELAAVFGIKFKKEANGDFDHSNVITLVDGSGLIRYQQIGLNQDPKDFLAKAEALKPK